VAGREHPRSFGTGDEKDRMNNFLIGTYQLGWRFCDVFAMPTETGGSFYWMPEGHERARIWVGFDYQDETPWVILCHEALEALIEDQGCRFRPTSSFVRNASDVYQFHFDHNQFTDISAKLGCFIFAIKDDFVAAQQLIDEENK
jgi:hypothetical protein